MGAKVLEVVLEDRRLDGKRDETTVKNMRRKRSINQKTARNIMKLAYRETLIDRGE